MDFLFKLMNMSGRRTLVTGATGNLGRVISTTLASLGSDLILVDLPGADFTSLERELVEQSNVNFISLVCDLEIQEAREIMLDKVKSDGLGIDCLINNAAFVGTSKLTGWATPFEKQSLEVWRRSFEVNLTAIFHLTQALAPELRLSQSGSVVNIASIYGLLGPDWELYQDTEMGNPAAYAASKGGLLQLSRWLATTLAPQVRVNTISPGGIFRNQPKSFIDRYVEKTPLKRMATEDDLRGAIAYLATDMSRYVTGQNLVIDGGFTIW